MIKSFHFFFNLFVFYQSFLSKARAPENIPKPAILGIFIFPQCLEKGAVRISNNFSFKKQVEQIRHTNDDIPSIASTTAVPLERVMQNLRRQISGFFLYTFEYGIYYNAGYDIFSI